MIYAYKYTSEEYLDLSLYAGIKDCVENVEAFDCCQVTKSKITKCMNGWKLPKRA